MALDSIVNKPYTPLSILSSGLLQFLMMLVIYNYFYLPEVQSHEGSQVVLLEMEDGTTAAELTSVYDEIKQLDIGSTRIIDRHQTWNTLNREMGEESSLENPLRDMISVEMENDPDLLTSLESRLSAFTFISGVYGGEVAPAGCSRSHLSSEMKLIPSLLILLILSYLFFRFFVKRSLRLNQQSFESLALYGAEKSYFDKMLRRLSLSTAIRGWLVGVLLFLVLVYLIYGEFGIDNGDISTIKFVLSLMIPLGLTSLMGIFTSRV